MLEFTMVFPPLKKGVKYIGMYQKFPQMKAPSPSNSGKGWCYKNLRLADYIPPKNWDLYYDKEGRSRKSRDVVYKKLRDDQVSVVDMPYASATTITSITTDKHETRVIIAVPIAYDRHWLQFDKGFCIEDCRNEDTCPILAVDRGIELNKTLIVVGQKRKMMEFTMIFPPRKKKVKRINL